jgi:endonuclease/exonuclease/phosphatase family metal-dependent hydrolase
MNKLTTLIAFIFFINFSNAQNLNIPAFGTDSTFEAITWNIEWFPKNGQTTVNYVHEIILDLDVDLLALQEIDDKTYFDQLLEGLDGWDGYYVVSEYSNLAYIYKTDEVEVHDIYEIYTTEEYWRPFPRAPMVMEMRFKNQEYVLINNHYKCCGDGYLDLSDPWDEETRRFDASNLLAEYIDTHFPAKRLIMMGDLNDDIADSPNNNVFNIFIDDPEKFEFVDMDIAEGVSSEWSYPSWPSHLDHVLISSALFYDFGNEGSGIETLKIDDYFDSFYQYDANVSDHRPVALKVWTPSYVSINTINDQKLEITNYPNPFTDETTIDIGQPDGDYSVVIFDINGKKVDDLKLVHGQASIQWNTSALVGGVYFAKIYSGNTLVTGRIMILVRNH